MRDTLAIDRALAVWLGKDSSAWPLRDDAAVLEAFVPDKGNDLLAELRLLESDFYGPPLRDQPLPLRDVGQAQTTESRAEAIRRLHPELSDSANPDSVVGALLRRQMSSRRVDRSSCRDIGRR
jgi:hypothetical protein